MLSALKDKRNFFDTNVRKETGNLFARLQPPVTLREGFLEDVT